MQDVCQYQNKKPQIDPCQFLVETEWEKLKNESG